jgi:hypothetical protein
VSLTHSYDFDAISLLCSHCFQFLFAENKLSGSLPDGLGNLTALKEMVGSGNDFGGSVIPTTFAKLIQMELFQFVQAALGGTLPSFVLDGTWSNLSIVILTSNSLEGNIADDIGKLSNLCKSLFFLDIQVLNECRILSFVGCLRNRSFGPG